MTAGYSDPFGLLGQVLDGQFRIDEVVGEGGSSVVYRGEHVGFDSKVAIKCLKMQAQLGSALVESFMRRFRDEGRVSYKLSQGNFHIARCLAIGTTIAPKSSSLVPYTVIEWLDGHSLARELEERRLAGGQGRPLEDLVALLDSAVDAIAYAHSQGVTHRDVNPGNIFLAQVREGGVQAKVLDFGVAKIVSDPNLPDPASGPMSTPVPFRVFSPAYAAPEQFDERLGPVGPWTDVYALAMVLLEGMRDQPPLLGLSMRQMVAKTLDPSSRPTPRSVGVMVSDDVEAVFERALARQPGERTEDASAFWSALKSAANIGSKSIPADATQRMDAFPDSDDFQMSVSYRERQGAVVDKDERTILDEETTIDERLERTTLPGGPDYAARVNEWKAMSPEVSEVHTSSPANEPLPDFSGPRARMPSADSTGPHPAMSADATGPRQAVAGAGRAKRSRSSVFLAALLGGGGAAALLVGLAVYLPVLMPRPTPKAAPPPTASAAPSTAPTLAASVRETAPTAEVTRDGDAPRASASATAADAGATPPPRSSGPATGVVLPAAPGSKSDAASGATPGSTKPAGRPTSPARPPSKPKPPTGPLPLEPQPLPSEE